MTGARRGWGKVPMWRRAVALQGPWHGQIWGPCLRTKLSSRKILLSLALCCVAPEGRPTLSLTCEGTSWSWSSIKAESGKKKIKNCASVIMEPVNQQRSQPYLVEVGGHPGRGPLLLSTIFVWLSPCSRNQSELHSFNLLSDYWAPTEEFWTSFLVLRLSSHPVQHLLLCSGRSPSLNDLTLELLSHGFGSPCPRCCSSSSCHHLHHSDHSSVLWLQTLQVIAVFLLTKKRVVSMISPAQCHHDALVLSGRRCRCDVIQETLESDLFSAYFLSVVTLEASRGRPSLKTTNRGDFMFVCWPFIT